MKEKNSLKPIFSRKLKNGKYVILAADSEPLVVDEEAVNQINQDINMFEKCDEETISVFRDSGFFVSSVTDEVTIPEEGKALNWKIARYGLFVVAIISIIGIILTVPVVGIPFGNRIIADAVPLWKSIIYMIFVSVATTAIHEIMHMIFAQTWGKRAGGLKVKLRGSVATVSMTHIWNWSLIGRLSAVSAGIVSDLSLLFVCSIFRLYFDYWVLAATASILWVRILWQFRFNRKSDGRLMAMVALDNPIIPIDDNDEFVSKEEIFIWKLLKGIGVAIEVIIVFGWIIPFVFNIFFHSSSIV